MKDTAARIKIGGVTLTSALLFVLMVFAISRVSFKPTRDIRVDFSTVNSLEVHAPVRFAGARIGEVKRIHILTEDERREFTKDPPYIYVYANVDKSVGIPKDTKGIITTMGVMGEKYLELMPQSRSSSLLVGEGPIEGIDPIPMDTVLASAKKLSDEMQIAAKNLNTMVTEMQNRLPVLIAEFEKTLASAQDLAADAKKLAADVQEKLPSLSEQFEKTLTSAQDLASDAKKLTGNFQNTLDIARTLADNANRLTDKANTILRANEEEIHHMIQNARQMTIYFKSLSHTLAQRPWKLVWGWGGPVEIEAEDVKFVPPPLKQSSESVELREEDSLSAPGSKSR